MGGDHRRETRSGVSGPAPLPEIGPARRRRSPSAERTQPRRASLSLTTAIAVAGSAPIPVANDAELINLSSERRELLCSVIGLGVKLGLVAVAGVSLFRLAGAYQQRMDRQGEITAVLELQSARLNKARQRFDQLFMTEGEQRLIREQSQWIAPNRMRVVWQDRSSANAVQTASVPGSIVPPASLTPRR